MPRGLVLSIMPAKKLRPVLSSSGSGAAGFIPVLMSARERTIHCLQKSAASLNTKPSEKARRESPSFNPADRPSFPELGSFHRNQCVSGSVFPSYHELIQLKFSLYSPVLRYQSACWFAIRGAVCAPDGRNGRRRIEFESACIKGEL